VAHLEAGGSCGLVSLKGKDLRRACEEAFRVEAEKISFPPGGSLDYPGIMHVGKLRPPGPCGDIAYSVTNEHEILVSGLETLYLVDDVPGGLL
jgi:hypothetical protein